jgi:methylisocitrate lyase
MNTQPEFRKRLRTLIETEGVQLPGAYNGITARIIKKLGFKGIYISGGGLSAAAGFPDIGLLTLSEFLTFAQYIVRATDLPCICDADTGFGEAVNVFRTVQEFERIGMAGLHIEDQVFPKRCGHLEGKKLVDEDQMVEKVRTAALARTDPDFLIIARTDARAVEGFDQAVRRAKAYVKAGADVIFPEALKTREEFQAFAKEVRVPLLANMTEFGVSPLMTATELFQMGYKLVIYPMGAFRASLKVSQEFYQELLARGTQEACIGKMTTRKELYDILDYDDYAKMDSRVAGFRPH